MTGMTCSPSMRTSRSIANMAGRRLSSFIPAALKVRGSSREARRVGDSVEGRSVQRRRRAPHPDRRSLPSGRPLRAGPVGRSTLLLQASVKDTSQIFQARATPCPQTFARFLNPPQKTRIVFQPIFEPVVLPFEPDQHASRLTVPRNNDVPLCRFSHQIRQVVLYLGHRNFPHPGFPNRASHVAASDLFTIAKISTDEFDTS